jgi:transposase
MSQENLNTSEVPNRPVRRRFPKEVKLKILDEIDHAPGEIGLILRREGLYSSHLVQWRRWREKMGESGSKSIHNENAKLKREVARLNNKLKRAETIIELQKKISEMLDLPPANEKNESL